MLMDDIKEKLLGADPWASWWPFIIAGAVFLVTTLKAYMNGQYCPNGNLITDQVVIVTGADGGIGAEIVKELAKRAATVVMCCRSVENGEKVRAKIQRFLGAKTKVRIDIRQLDLRSFENIREFVKAFENDYSKCDVLINNAGVTFHPFAKTSDGYETHLQVNYLGHFLLTHLLLPMLQKSQSSSKQQPGRIINVSAHAYSAGRMCIDDPLNISNLTPQYHSRDAFAHSKLAVVLWTRKLARILKAENVTVNCLSPGLVRGTQHMRHSTLMKAISMRIIMFPCMFVFMKTATLGAQTAIHLATDDKNATTTGKFFNDCEIIDIVEQAKDDKLADKLYAETLRVLKLK